MGAVLLTIRAPSASSVPSAVPAWWYNPDSNFSDVPLAAGCHPNKCRKLYPDLHFSLKSIDRYVQRAYLWVHLSLL
jgi:hypothetical protein